MIVAFSTCLRDHDLAVATLEWDYDLDGQLDYDCILSLGAGFDREPVILAANKLFRNVTVRESEAPDTWPNGKNWTFQQLVRYLHDKKNKQPFAWLEPDSIALKKGWLKTLEEEYEKGGKPFAGWVHPTLNYMECVGIYPHNVMDYSQSAMLCRAGPWDMVAKDDIIPNCHRMNHLMQSVHSIDGFCPTFKDLSMIQSGAVLFHRNKDGTLIEQLSKGRWKRFFSFGGNGGGVVALRRAGDLVSLLPAIQQMAREKGKPIRVITSNKIAGNSYLELLEGASYVKGEGWAGDWEDPLKAAAEFRATNAQVTGRGIIPELNNGNFCKDAWTKLGMKWNKYCPPQFDLRNWDREQQLIGRTFHNGAPKVLVKLHGESSPYPDKEWLKTRIVEEFTGKCELIWLDDVKAERAYDLMALMDKADCLVSIDTIALHLAHGCTVPVIALVNGTKFSATPPKGNCVLRIPYLESTGRWKDISDVISASIDKTFNDRMVHVYSPYEPHSSEEKRRNSEAFATWQNLGARLFPFVGNRHSGSMGDAHQLPFFRDMIRGAMNSGDEGIIVLSNNDVRIDPALADEIKKIRVEVLTAELI